MWTGEAVLATKRRPREGMEMSSQAPLHQEVAGSSSPHCHRWKSIYQVSHVVITAGDLSSMSYGTVVNSTLQANLLCVG